MVGAIVVVAAIFGVLAGIALSWAWTTTQPSQAVALPGPDVRVLAHHEQARIEIQTIERVTRQLMRAAASSSVSSPAAMRQVRPTTSATPTFSGEPAAGPSFAWSPDPVASSSSSPGRVRLSASNPWRS